VNFLHACRAWARSRVSPRRARYFSLLRQRKVSKRKATLLSASLRCAALHFGQPAVLAFCGVWLNSANASNNASPDPQKAALLGAYRRAFGDKTNSGRNWLPSICFDFLPTAVMRRRATQGWADQGWRCLSAASLARPRSARVAQRTRAPARSDESGSPFFCLLCFGEAKKSESPAGARPGLVANQQGSNTGNSTARRDRGPSP